MLILQSSMIFSYHLSRIATNQQLLALCRSAFLCSSSISRILYSLLKFGKVSIYAVIFWVDVACSSNALSNSTATLLTLFNSNCLVRCRFASSNCLWEAVACCTHCFTSSLNPSFSVARTWFISLNHFKSFSWSSWFIIKTLLGSNDWGAIAIQPCF